MARKGTALLLEALAGLKDLAWTLEVWLERPPADLWLAAWLTVFALAQWARFWVLATLGERWSTRILVLPGAALVRRGPYRWLRHPNYGVIVIELASLALAFRAYDTLLLALVSQAIVLRARIRAEERAQSE